MIMKAKRKKIESISIDDFDLKNLISLKIKNIKEPPKRSRGIMVETVDELIDKLKNEAKVL